MPSRLLLLSLVLACAPRPRELASLQGVPARPPGPAAVAAVTGEPSRDGDGDRVADDVDRCPEDEETSNGHRDDDGCPDEPPVGRAYFANGLRGVRFGRPELLPQSGADAPVGYFFSTTDERTTENYPYVPPDRFVMVAASPRSMLAANADTAAFPQLRRFLVGGTVPPAGIVRVESLIDYFEDEAPPVAAEGLAIGAEVGPCPWAPQHRLVRVRVQAAKAPSRPRLFVLAVDVSGSMGGPERLPLLRRGLGTLLDGLQTDDRVAVVGFGGTAEVALPPTSMPARAEIEAALARLKAGGTSRGRPGLELARAFVEQRRAGELVHVVLASDGNDVFWPKARSRVEHDALAVVEVGAGDGDDAALSQVAQDHGGHLIYVDTLEEARRAFARIARQGPTLARDVQLQASFDPARVSAYRVVGHANLQIAEREFRTDVRAAGRVAGGPLLGRARAGELAAGRGFTVLYEVVPAAGAAVSMTLRVRGRVAGRDRRWTHEVRDAGRELPATSNDFRFSAAVAVLGLVLNGGLRGSASVKLVRELAAGAVGRDEGGERAGLVRLIEQAAPLLEAREREWAPFDAWLASQPLDPLAAIPRGELPTLQFEAMRMRVFSGLPSWPNGVKYRIVGHAGEREGSQTEREAVARARAQAVMRYLVETMRLPPALFEVAVALDPASSSMLGPTVSFELILPQ